MTALGGAESNHLRGALETATRLGFSGIELVWDGAQAGSRTDLLGAVQEIQGAAEDDTNTISICSIGTHAALHHANESAWRRAQDDVRFALGMARDVGAATVRVFGYSVARGEGRSSVISRIGRRLRELAHMGREITGGKTSVVLQNGGSFVNARELWTIIEAAGQTDGAGICWDAGEAALEESGGDTSGLAVTTLNSRIRLARLWDHAGTRKPIELGTGVVQSRHFLERLRGIGYGGWLLYAPPATASDPSQSTQFLETAAARMKEWLGIKPTPAATEEKAIAK